MPLVPVYQYMFVEPSYSPPEGTSWTRCEVDLKKEHPDADQPRDLPEGLDGPTVFISQRIYDAWKHLLIDGLHRITQQRPEHLAVNLNRLWTPERSKLVRVKVAEIFLGVPTEPIPTTTRQCSSSDNCSP